MSVSTEEKQFVATAARLQAILERNRVDLIAALSAAIRTELTPILGFAEAIELMSNEPTSRKYAEHIAAAALRARAILQRVEGMAPDRDGAAA